MECQDNKQYDNEHFGFIPITDFEHKFKNLILDFSNLNSNPKLQNFNIAVSIFIEYSAHFFH